jgi:hypothetical protein
MVYEIPHGPTGTIADKPCIWIAGLNRWASLQELGLTYTPTPPTPAEAQPLGVPGNWALDFEDTFQGTQLADWWAPNWFGDGTVLVKFEAKGKRLPWQGPADEFEQVLKSGAFGGSMNNVHTYAANVAVSNGLLLKLVSQSSGALVSTNPNGGAKNGKTFVGGYFEAKISLPGNSGKIYNWPAFWTDGQYWPTDGEMDIMEGLGGLAACHFHSSVGGPGFDLSGDYTGTHIFGAYWKPGQFVNYYYDGKLVGSIAQGITSQPMYIVLNVGVGEGSQTIAPSIMSVAYVRHWSGSPTA